MTATIKIWDCIEPLVPEWERLARHTEASPFLWPGWIRAWWLAFGAGQLQIFTAYDENGRLAGILPLRRFRGALSSPTNSETPLFGLLAANKTTVEQLLHALLSQKPRRIDLSLLSPTDISVSLAPAAADHAQYRVLTESIQAAPYIAIDRTWEEYESGLRRKFRSELRRRRRRLEEEGQITLEVFDGTESLDELLEEGLRVEGLGWKGAYGTSINSSSATRRFYAEVAQWATEHGWLRLAFLRLNGQALAFDYCLEHNKIHYLLKTGYDPAYRNFAPGMIIRYLMLARAFSEELTIYDFLGSDYSTTHHEWKQEWSTALQERLFLRMFASTAFGVLDQVVFAYGSSTSEHARTLARRVVGERGRHLLKRGRALVRTRFDG